MFELHSFASLCLWFGNTGFVMSTKNSLSKALTNSLVLSGRPWDNTKYGLLTPEQHPRVVIGFKVAFTRKNISSLFLVRASPRTMILPLLPASLPGRDSYLNKVCPLAAIIRLTVVSICPIRSFLLFFRSMSKTWNCRNYSFSNV